ncbi:MAG: hypothetical protein JWO50_429 [Candidatus Kaiserbacteria bacterium]|nr:hypothetical protein [Candidatus Kaiserbacteria bacterium]
MNDQVIAPETYDSFRNTTKMATVVYSSGTKPGSPIVALHQHVIDAVVDVFEFPKDKEYPHDCGAVDLKGHIFYWQILKRSEDPENSNGRHWCLYSSTDLFRYRKKVGIGQNPTPEAEAMFETHVLVIWTPGTFDPSYMIHPQP